MTADISRSFLIIGGLLLALLVLQAPNILLWSAARRVGSEFAANNPAWGWLPDAYTLFLILWIPIALVATARLVEQTTLAVFLTAVILIPYSGAALIIGLFEALTGISPRLGLRQAKGGVRPWVRTSFDFRRNYTVYVAGPMERVRAVGGLRIVLAALSLGFVAMTVMG